MATYRLIHRAQQSTFDDEPLPLEENPQIAKVASEPLALMPVAHPLLATGAQFFCKFCQRAYWAGQPTDREWLRLNKIQQDRKRRRRRTAYLGAVIAAVLFTVIWYLQVPVLSLPFMMAFFGLFVALGLGSLALSGGSRCDLIVLNRFEVTDEDGGHELEQVTS